MATERISDPQQWNLYPYTRNNPFAFLDPDGKELRPVSVHLSGGRGIQYIDVRLVQRLQQFARAARERGLTFTFNRLYATQEEQAAVTTTNTKNITGTSPHTAGLAVDINVRTSLKPSSATLSDLNAAAAVEGSQFSPLLNQDEDPGHYQANDLIIRDATGKLDQSYRNLIEENRASFRELEELRRSNPAEFEKLVVEIDTYTPRSCIEGTCEP